jgi:DNA repair protein RadA/Sms
MIVTRLWKLQPGRYFCISTKSASGTWKDHFFKRREFRLVNKFIKANADKDIYFCPHGFSEPRRLKPHAVLPNLLWSDMDEADPKDVAVKPTIAIESSPGRYVGLWMIDKVMTEELNRRLAYGLGGDTSGWDLTQVLRVPGTRNNKYPSRPRVRLLWLDGPDWTVRQLEKKLPADDIPEIVETSDAAEVMRKNEKIIPPWVRRELRTNRKPPEGKRSEMIWKLGNSLLEAGLTRDEAFVLLKASVWNKFAGRRNEDEQLRRELEKALNRKHQAKNTVVGEGEHEDDDDYVIGAKSLNEVEEEDISWVWYPFLARGKVTILEGDPEAGKSYIAQMISGGIGRGDKLPCETKDIPIVQGRVLYFDLENDAATVTKKRMRWNGFDDDTMRNFYQEERPFSIEDEGALEKVYQAMERIKPVLVVFDTLNTYIGSVNTSQGAQGQQAFVKFLQIAQRFNCAMLVLRHLTKGGRDKAMYRGQGNIAFTGIARSVMLCGRHPEDPDMRVMAASKTSFTRKPRSICYEICDKGTKKERDRSELQWGKFVDLTADEVVMAEPQSNNKEKEEALEFLEAALESGPMELSKLRKMAETRSIQDRMMRKASEELGVVKETKVKDDKKTTTWSLP